ncbi:BgtA-20472 [Blumeria graminis f. sp. tritici]|uniref:Ribonuclease H2 subunit B n=2 Tax=Blumeria graminis f. sp. tritici TaxID=62690 RepID=A0A9X9MPC4_BLUGR|nr:hypothetical protein BGT96224_A20472 [Blumeria graminis f. sp. tritici 96224]VDB95068.1 BgtA-20472 [Blumeria graminis f. sp. tritici]
METNVRRRLSVQTHTHDKTLTDNKFQCDQDSKQSKQVYLLPKDVSSEARIISIKDPKHSNNTRYLVCPTKGIFEFKKIAAPLSTPQSWLICPASHECNEKITDDLEEFVEGYITKNALLFIATLVDPLFIILPTLMPAPTKILSEPVKRLFLSSDEYLDRLVSRSPQLGYLMETGSIKTRLEQRIVSVCDMIEAGDEKMYRINDDKLILELINKAKRMVSGGLPESFEEKFIRRFLEAPVMSKKREFNSDVVQESNIIDATTSIPTSTEAHATPLLENIVDDHHAQGPIPVKNPLPKNISADEKYNSSPDAVKDLLRIRTCLCFINSSYISTQAGELIKSLINENKFIDFSPLDAHLAELVKLRQDAFSSRSMNDFSRKRSAVEDEGSMDRAHKKQKEQDDKKRQAKASRGVKALKKVNVSGMKKMNEFFTKK